MLPFAKLNRWPLSLVKQTSRPRTLHLLTYSSKLMWRSNDCKPHLPFTGFSFPTLFKYPNIFVERHPTSDAYPSIAVIGARVLGRRIALMYASHGHEGSNIRYFSTSAESGPKFHFFGIQKWQWNWGFGNQDREVMYHVNDLDAVIKGYG